MVEAVAGVTVRLLRLVATVALLVAVVAVAVADRTRPLAATVDRAPWARATC